MLGQLRQTPRLSQDAGIAIGPILFVVAILGVLAAAIAAGSGSFTGSSSAESARTKAAALIQIGQNLKVGMDRLQGLGYSASDVIISPTATSADTDLFSPSGGGVTAPSVTMANTPASDLWHYPYISITNMGTATSERLATVRVALDVCNQINQRANAITGDAASVVGLAADVGDLTSTADPAAGFTAWPGSLAGKSIGCLKNTDASATNTYWFYQILSIR
jgi:hypothetical protein